MEKKHSGKAWLALIACIITMMFGYGIPTNCLGTLYAGMSADMDAPTSAIMLFSTFKAVTMTITLPFIGKLLANTKKPKVLFMVATIIVTGCYALLATVQNLPMLYVIGVIAGLATGLVAYMTVPFWINKWFADKAALMLGIGIAGSAVGSMVFSPIAAKIIADSSWRECCVILGLMALVVCFVVQLLCLHEPKSPDERYGAAKAAAAAASAGAAAGAAAPARGITAKTALRSPAFYFTWLFVFCFYFIGNCLLHIPNLAVSFGYELILGSTLVSVVSATGLVCQLFMGGVVQKFGWFKTVIVGLIFGCGSVVCWLSGNGGTFATIMFAGAVLYGLCVSMPQVVCPLMAQNIVGEKEYTKIWSYVSTAVSLSGALGVPALGLIYDLSGTYVTTLYVIIAFAVVALVALIGAKVTSKKLVFE